MINYLIATMLAMVPLVSVYGQNDLSAEQQEVLDIVDRFFESMTDNDLEVAREIMLAEGMTHATRNDGDSIFLAIRTHADYFERLKKTERTLIERIWDPTIMVHKEIAMLWAPYDIYIDGEFLHCGVDCFTLVKTDEGWKISGTIFTMEPTGCAESPLGPLKK